MPAEHFKVAAAPLHAASLYLGDKSSVDRERTPSFVAVFGSCAGGTPTVWVTEEGVVTGFFTHRALLSKHAGSVECSSLVHWHGRK